ncbi:toll/interleukin-1 receptor domain-containing protein [Kitasatospora sp. NPDC088346]|uniref:toll/interleukin-1 receptor domain-containing protein n=1 Tax=Kitasatospora sp. NPDC088346 TaxID=3364073 RepID=UPI0038149ECC
MPDIFVNYRTGDADSDATLIETVLSHRFGSERVFRASKSIGPGRRFPQELITAVRRCSVLLVVIGPRWAEAPAAGGGRALDDPEDWTRREILEAFDSGALVIPVLVGKGTRLKGADLPPVLSELADHQYRRLDNRNAEADLARIGDELAELVPELGAVEAARKADRRAPQDDDGHVSNSAGEVHGTQIQARDLRHRQRGGIGNLTGDLSGTFIGESHGPVHAGSGNQYNAPQFSGDGVNYVAGDNSGAIRQQFGGRRRGEER